MKRIVFMFVLVPFLLQSANVTVSVRGIKGSKGKISIGLYNKSQGFLKISSRYKGVHLRTRGQSLRYTFKSIPDGVYAVGVFHDTNRNGRLDKNFLGIPKEGYGISNNPNVFGQPTFSQCKFRVSKHKKITIRIKY